MNDAGELERLSAALGGWSGATPVEGGEIGCLETGRIWSAVSGELGPRAFREAAEHAVTCRVCGPRWRLALLLARERREHGPTAGGGRTTRPRTGRGWLMLAAVSATIAVAAFFADWRAHRPPPASVVERGAETAALRSALGERPALDRETFVLRWKAPPEASVFRVEVATADARVLDVSPAVEAREYTVPPEKLAGVGSGETIHWRVEAHLADGRVLRSPIFDVDLR